MSAAPENAKVRAMIEITKAIADVVKELGSVPSGTVYAHAMGTLTLEQYELVIDVLKDIELVEEKNHVLTWVGPITRVPR